MIIELYLSISIGVTALSFLIPLPRVSVADNLIEQKHSLILSWDFIE